MPPSATRPLAAAAALGGACWIALAVSSVLSSADDSGRKVVLDGAGEYLEFALFAVALALTVPLIAALHLHQRGADGRLGQIGAWVAGAGAAAQCVVISTIVVTGEEPSWFGVAAPVAILTWVVGSIVLGVATRRGRVMPGWVSVALPIVTALAIVGSNAGTSALIGVFAILGGLRIARATAATATPPVGPAAEVGA